MSSAPPPAAAASSPTSNSTSPPPSTPSSPPPATSSSPPPATGASPPQPAPSPPPATPSSPPPAVTPSPPPPVTPSPPPPVTPSPPPPVTPTPTPSPPAVTPSPPPVTPSPPPVTPSPPPAPATPAAPPTPSATPANPAPPPAAPSTPFSPPSRANPPPSTPPATPSTTPSSNSSTPSPALPSPTTPPSSSQSSPTSLIVGVTIGGLLFLLVAGIVGVFCCRRKRRHSSDMMQYGDPYGGQHQNWQQSDPPSSEQVIKMPPSYPSPQAPYASRHPQLPPLPPPPEMIMNSSGSGSNYSGGDVILPPPSPGIALGFSKSIFTYEELRMATNGFSDANLLGQGGFGYVHRGVLPNGKEVAVKQLKIGSGQGEREFQAEIEIISRVHHKHLVSLVGYCISGGQRLLVYEFVPNNTLEFHLHGKGRPTLEWHARMKIALGAAKGLAYLHEDCHPKIIHRDIKASNILLDYKFEAKVADFGLAKFTTDTNTHVSTRVMGTFGYLAPEYASSGKLTEKSDVFSFGVMLLELITGRRPVDTSQSYLDDSLVDWARPLLTQALEDGDYKTLVDPRLGIEYNVSEMARMIACAAACVRHSAKRRPRMSQVLRALEGDVAPEDLNEGVIPGHSRLVGSYGSSEYDSGQYNNDMKKFRKMALASQEYGSSQYSAQTSEYGQVASGSSSEGQHTQEMGEGSKTRS